MKTFVNCGMPFIALLFGGAMPCLIRGNVGPTDFGYITGLCIAYPLGVIWGKLDK
jgi:hypothetical protein